MPDLAERVAEARAHVDPSWSPERAARVRTALELAKRAHGRNRAVALGIALIACALAVLFVALRRPAPGIASVSPPIPASATAIAPLVGLPDGSNVVPRSADARVQPIAVSARGVTLRLESGAARFSVMPNAARPFEVLARDVSVTVLGTVFDVALEAHGVRVSVERGRVRARSITESRELGPGESALFATAPAPASKSAAATKAPGNAAQPQFAPSWRALASDGDYPGALARLGAEGPSAVRDTPEDLLLAADVARLGGRPDRAVAPLQRVVSAHAGDSRAPLAAFTLGRTLLDQLGRPREASQAFYKARSFDPTGALAQDALAREVESWSRAGEAAQARERALEYLKLYPRGRRASSVKRHGGIE